MKSFRFGILLPLTALRSVLPAPVAGTLLPLVASLAGILFVALIGRRLAGENAGIAAATHDPTTGSIVRRLLIDIPNMLLNPLHPPAPPFGLYFPLAAGAIWLVRRERSSRPALILGASLFVCFLLVPARIWPYVPGVILHRHLQPLLIPAVLLMGMALALRRRLLWGAPARGSSRRMPSP